MHSIEVIRIFDIISIIIISKKFHFFIHILNNINLHKYFELEDNFHSIILYLFIEMSSIFEISQRA